MPVSSKYSKIAAAQQAEKTKTAAGEGDGVRYNLKNTTDKNVVSIKQQIENVAQELNAADPVARKTVFNIFGSMNIKQKRAWAEAEALKYGNRVDRQEYGSIEVSRTSKVSIPADGENVRQQFSLKAPVEEKNLLALHNLTEKNLLGRQRTPSFNPRPPRGGRPHGDRRKVVLSGISIHAPREGGDLASAIPFLLVFDKFQSTPPARGATSSTTLLTLLYMISIHAPREGGDWSWRTYPPPCWHFNPRPPRGGRRRRGRSSSLWTRYFNPRPPRGGRLSFRCSDDGVFSISIHAPREGGDLYAARQI